MAKSRLDGIKCLETIIKNRNYFSGNIFPLLNTTVPHARRVLVITDLALGAWLTLARAMVIGVVRVAIVIAARCARVVARRITYWSVWTCNEYLVERAV